MRLLRFCSVVAAALLFTGAAAARDVPVSLAKPEAVGFSGERLQRLESGMKAAVDANQLSGIVTIAARHGRVVHEMAYGKRDLETGAPMQKDTIFRIYSMTKPIVGAAMMMLYEEGKWRPRDPITQYIPEFRDLKVFAGLDEQGKPVFEALKRPPTMGELMSHTAGFTYGVFGSTPVDKQYQQVNPLQAASMQDFIDRMAKLPLAYQPGEAWVYSVSVDIQGYLVEKLSGQPLAQFLRTRIFEPLGMKDTAFYVPQEKLSRLAKVYAWNAADQSLAPTPHDPGVSAPPGFPSGGGGLYSTAYDYLRFAQMLANNGELNGVRLLAPSTIALMRSNHVPEHVRSGNHGIGSYRVRDGVGFGFDVAVFEEPHKIGSAAGAGTYTWNGLAGTWFWIDPTNDVLFIGMIQRRGGPTGAPSIEELSRQLIFQALVDPTK